MVVTSDKDFPQLRRQLSKWRKQFSMFVHDVNHIEQAVEKHIQNYAIAGVHYRQTKQKQYLERAQHELDEINRIISTAEKMELMSLLSRG
jgi:pyridoxine 5'-phosphate synthase PdxJ